MNDEHRDLTPGYWRNASRPLHVYGIPAPLFLLYLFWFRFPNMDTLYVISAVIIFFRLLSAFGWSFGVMTSRLVYWIRGKQLAGRPWWYRRFTEDE